MSTTATPDAVITHSLPGRLRVHLGQWGGRGSRAIERQLRSLPGVLSAQANALTQNVLVKYDSSLLDERRVVSACILALDAAAQAPEREHTPPIHHVSDRRGKVVRARIAVRGLDRDPNLAAKVVEHLHRRPNVRAVPNAITGRVLVEYVESEVDVQDLISELADIELPESEFEDRPSHPLDTGPLIQSSARLGAASMGLLLLGTRQFMGVTGPVGTSTIPTQSALVFGIVQSFPPIRNFFRHLLGRNVADLVFALPGIISMTLTATPLGLLVTLGEALRLFTMVVLRRTSWRNYEERIVDAPLALPGTIVRLDAGERCPLRGNVIEGTGTSVERHGLPKAVAPGEFVQAGARLYGGPFVIELVGGRAFEPSHRPANAEPSGYRQYVKVSAYYSVAYAALTAVLTRSFSRTIEALLLVSPRTAVIGRDAASVGAQARVLRSGVIVVGTRDERRVRTPNIILIDGPRLLTDGYEITQVLPLVPHMDSNEALMRAAGISAAAGSPWGALFPTSGATLSTDGHFDGRSASAMQERVRYRLSMLFDRHDLPEASRIPDHGDVLLVFSREAGGAPIALFSVRPRIAAGVHELVQKCRKGKIELAILAEEDVKAAFGVSTRVDIPLIEGRDPVVVIRDRQRLGERIAIVSDHVEAAESFAAADMAIGISSGRSGRFAARADFLAPDISGVVSIVEAALRRDVAVRDSVVFSIAANIASTVLGLQGPIGVERAAMGVYIAALGALTSGWLRMRGEEKPRSAIARLADPMPERWGKRSVDEVIRNLDTTPGGLTSAQALVRRKVAPPPSKTSDIGKALLDQIRSPLTAVMFGGAVLSLLMGATLDVVLIAGTLVINVAVGAWQERQAGEAAEALRQMGTATARVVRDGKTIVLSVTEVVPGDLILLGPGDRVAADARLIKTRNLEVDEAALTGESLPVPKSTIAGADSARIVLEGSDVTAGKGRAIVVAVGRQTRLGATAAALDIDEQESSPLGRRLSSMLKQLLPVAAIGGVMVVGAGLIRRRPLLPQMAIGANIALAAVPEGLPLLAGIGEAAVGRRLATRNALVRRLAAVEALGRVDVACTDKTGTLTEGKLKLSAVADLESESKSLPEISDWQKYVLRTAGLASPHPDSSDAMAHPTDVAVMSGAFSVGLEQDLRVRRELKLPFDPSRAFHAVIVQGRFCAKGSPENLTLRCTHARFGDEIRPLGTGGRQMLLDRAQRLADRGLRVLMVVEGPGTVKPDDPQGLTALGYIGISDPLRAGVVEAILRCREAGVRVVMLTGDHPATARSIARDAGLMSGDEGLLTGDDLSELQNGDLDARLETATVIARATPLDKLRIVESMQRRGHTVAMTGDGVNDAPALRLADVGVAMGKGGTEVARQAADVVLADDDFATLVDALVEGRSFWRNIRRALSLLLGGNLGELGLVVGATLLGYASPLTTRQILAVNLITDAFPALSVALQKPEHRRLASLAREGAGAMDKPLRNDVIRRGLLTTLPTLVSYIVTLSTGSIDQARAVAFAGIVTTQLAQTLDAGWSEGSLTKPVILAVGTSAGMMVASLTIPVLRSALQLAMPSFPAWLMITGGVGVALIGSRAAQANGKLPTSVELKNMLPKPQRLLTGPVTAGNGTAAGLAGT